jgi:lysophospholipase L1-like esterase
MVLCPKCLAAVCGAAGDALLLVLLTAHSAAAGDATALLPEQSPASDPPQVCLCMVGDSITWAELGDDWRRHLLVHLPSLAFVGTHSARLGYSHAGEGGNGTAAVLARLVEIPDCTNYSLLIGTNDNGINDESRIQSHAQGTADRIAKIVDGLLAKPHCRKVFLGSILPCHTDNPLRDRTNAATNVRLRELLPRFPAGRVVYVDYEAVIRQTPDWEPMIRLHPTTEGYQLLARVLAESVRTELGLGPAGVSPVPRPGCGVRVTNLWEGGEDGRTLLPVIAGWYTLSFAVTESSATGAKVTVLSTDSRVDKPLAALEILPRPAAGRLAFEVFTGYEGYGYVRSVLALQTSGCRIDSIQFEKRRPSGQASTYATGTHLDTATPPSPGEVIESP